MNYPKRLVVLFAGLLLFVAVGPRAIAADAGSSLNPAMLELPSGTVEYIDAGGSGVPVIFLHPSNVRMFQNQITAFSKAGYHVIAVDLRNHTPGAAPEGFGGNKNGMRLNELVAKLGLPKFHLIGAAGAGPAALQYAREHPDQVRSVVMSGTLGGWRDPAVNALENSLRPDPFMDLPASVRELGPSYRAANPEGVKQWAALEEQGNAEVKMAPPPRPPGGGPFVPPPMPNALTTAKLEEWQLPTMMVAGDAALYTPPSLMRMFVSHLKNGEGAVVTESGQECYWENPTQYNRVVLRFIRKH